MASRVCERCRSPIEATALFCPGCGRLVSGEGVPRQTERAVRPRELERVLNWDGQSCLRAMNLPVEHLFGPSLFRANLCDSNLQGTNLTGAKLRGANLCHAHLECASLRAADLTSSWLVGSSLDESDLSTATLRDADLYRASLFAANLLGARLDAAFLMAANFTMARVSEEQFRRAWAMCGAVMPDGSLYDGRYGLEGDLHMARCEGYDPSRADDMARFHTASIKFADDIR